MGMVRSIQRQNVERQKWQHASLRSIQKKLGIQSLWDCIYVFQPMQEDGIGGEDLWQFDDSEEETAKIQVICSSYTKSSHDPHSYV